MIFNEMDVNMSGLESVFESSGGAGMPTFIYHQGTEQDRGRHQGIEQDRVRHQGNNEAIPHEVLKDEDTAVRLELRHSMTSHPEVTLGQEYVYEFVDTSGAKPKQLLTEDAEKRRVRRERNKLAASKCRKKRKDHVRNLVESYEQLEMCNKNLETEIEKLHNEIRELEKMLDTHPCTRLLYTETGNNSLS